MLLSPLFVIIGIWVVFDDGWPIFYVQKRVGRYNVDFNLLKFRSMYKRPSEGMQLTVGNDPRITRSGRFIRKYKIDELPQLINVLFGQMSLVGPRPEVRKYVNLYSLEQLQVLQIRPGITDFASLKYRNENDILATSNNPEETYIQEVMPDKLELNLEYIRNNSPLKDIQLILQTLKVIIK